MKILTKSERVSVSGGESEYYCDIYKKDAGKDVVVSKYFLTQAIVCDDDFETVINDIKSNIPMIDEGAGRNSKKVPKYFIECTPCNVKEDL